MLGSATHFNFSYYFSFDFVYLSVKSNNLLPSNQVSILSKFAQTEIYVITVTDNNRQWRTTIIQQRSFTNEHKYQTS